MTVMTDEDPAVPEVTEGEAWYDTEIAPKLAELAKLCNARGMSFLAQVEYQPGDRAGTYFLTEDAGLAMQMAYICARTAPNVDSYFINLMRHCQSKGIDTSACMVMKRLAA